MILCYIGVLAVAACNAQQIAGPGVQSQHQAQDTVIGHLRRTLAALPPGSVLDATRYAGAGHNSYCGDGVPGPGASVRFHTIGELRVPGDHGTDDAVAMVGDIWRSWGWEVQQRAGFRTPNRFGHSPDGYRLQIVAAAEAHPPTLQASSPCFPRSIARDDIAVPDVLDAG